MEKFILLFRGSDAYEADESSGALDALTEKMMDWLGNIAKKGQHVYSEKFHRSGKQIGGNALESTGIPLGNAKDIIGGCTVVLAENFDAAVAIAEACPILASNATIEVRQITCI